MQKQRMKIITHNDLDGVGCAVVAKCILDSSYNFIKFAGYDNINDIVMEALHENWDHVFITDISVSKEVAEYIDKHHREDVTLIDHHPGLDWLNEYDWAHITSLLPGEKASLDTPSGASLFYEYLKLEMNPKVDLSALEFFVDMVRQYDTWLWTTVYHNTYPKLLNDYLGIVGFFDFIDEMVDKVKKNDKKLLTDIAFKLLRYKQQEIDVYVKSKNKTLTKKIINGLNVGCVIAEKYHSELGNRLIEMNECLNVIIIYDICKNKISIRSKEGRDVNCTDIAKKWYGGGGHEFSSGAQIPVEITDNIMNELFRIYDTPKGDL